MILDVVVIQGEIYYYRRRIGIDSIDRWISVLARGKSSFFSRLFLAREKSQYSCRIAVPVTLALMGDFYYGSKSSRQRYLPTCSSVCAQCNE